DIRMSDSGSHFLEFSTHLSSFYCFSSMLYYHHRYHLKRWTRSFEMTDTKGTFHQTSNTFIIEYR
uniref:Uncharacterized protein n=1 Tax=Aegilops tauschii subsp. strangulata TaxID=200361 RepID=A0A453S6J1_AEGTS